jgi:mono/diheme cytochrome c family protein
MRGEVMRRRAALSADPVTTGNAGRPRRSLLALAAAPLVCMAMAAPAAFAQGTAGSGSSEAFHNLLQGYCLGCHNTEDWAGSLAFDLLDLEQPAANPDVWEHAIEKLRGRLMPPAGAEQPSQDEVNAVVAYLESAIDAAASPQRVGHVPIQRLNRTEFSASVKGLIGVDLDPGQILPTEIEVEGFDNIAGALGISPSFLEQYLSAARLAARRAVGEPVPKFSSIYYPSDGGTQRAPTANQTMHRDGFPLGTRGGMSFMHVFPADGEYRFNILDVDAGLYPRGMETAATLVILVDGEEVARLDIGGPEDLALADRDGPAGRDAIIAKLSGIPAQVKAGAHEVIATFIDRSWAASNDAAGGGRVSGVPRIQDGMEVEGPFAPAGLSMNESRSKIFVCEPTEAAEERPCAEQIARQLATRAFRRPVNDSDLEWLMPFYEAGRAEAGGFDAGITELVTAILSSPDFLYRAIRTAQEPGMPRALDDLELASRLAFFLWSQGPDDELIALAAEGRLSAPGVLDQQVDRMLADPRAQALVENFALGWLNLDELEQVEPLDPSFNSGMRRNFEIEIRLFLASILLENRPVTELLTADHTFLNESLAQQYDVSGVLGPQFRRVQLANENRWGLLGKGAMLLRTSYGDRTSPVLRGAWVLDRLIGTPPTPPPPNVETDLSVREGEKPTTVRARLEAHRENPTCQGCHGVIDPPGLALENFDVTGRWRDVDAQAREAIDATAVLSNGTVLKGPADLRRYLLSQPDQFPLTVTHRLMMYALAREIEYFDMPHIRRIVREAAADDYRFATIIKGIVNSELFRQQGPEEDQEAAAPGAVAVN